MFDRDLLLLQVCGKSTLKLIISIGFQKIHENFQTGAALTEADRFLMHAMHRYRIDKWADENFEGFTRWGQFWVQ